MFDKKNIYPKENIHLTIEMRIVGERITTFVQSRCSFTSNIDNYQVETNIEALYSHVTKKK